MNPNHRDPDMLVSWKEIAAHLGVDERTCQRYEKQYGLPVRRIEEAKKSRIFASRAEIDEWLTGAKRNGRIDPAEAAALGRSDGSARAAGSGDDKVGAVEAVGRSLDRRKIWPVVAGLGLVVVLGVLAGPRLLSELSFSRSEPADFRIEGARLVILDRSGRELGSYNHSEILERDSMYRNHFQTRRPAGIFRDMPYIMFRDIDGDGRNDVLFSIQTPNETNEGRLLRLDAKGRELWRFDAGEARAFGGKPFGPDYRIHGFDMDDLDGDGRSEIVLSANHFNNWPCRVCVLDAAGRLLGDFWNSGYISDFVFEDLNGDGCKEILATGTNNEFGEAVVLAFDAFHLSGCSPNTGEYRMDGQEPGTELAYIRLPRIDVDRLPRPDGLYTVIEAGGQIDAVAGGFRTITQLSGLVFSFDSAVQHRDVILSHSFKHLYSQHAALGRVPPVMDEAAYHETIMAGLKYWDGQAWSSTPVPLRWVDRPMDAPRSDPERSN